MDKLNIKRPKIMIVCSFFLTGIFTATTIMILYYYNYIMENRDIDREHFCDITFTNKLTTEDILSLQSFCENNLSDFETLMFILSENMGLCKMGCLNADKDMTDVIVYGAEPLFVEDYKLLSMQDLSGINKIVIECKKSISYNTLKKIKCQAKMIDSNCTLKYQNKFKWLVKNIKNYIYIVILMLSIIIFSFSSLILIEKFIIEKNRKVIVVCMICGAENEYLIKAYMKEYFFRQIVSLAISFALSYFLIYGAGLFDIKELYFAPFWVSVLVAMMGCFAYKVMLSTTVNKNIMDTWRKV